MYVINDSNLFVICDSNLVLQKKQESTAINNYGISYAESHLTI